MSDIRKVLVILVDRANYGRLRPVMRAIKERPELDLLTVCTGTMVLRRFDRPVDVVRADGFHVHGEVFLELEGSTPTTMAKSVGFATIELASELQRLKPDLVLLIGDRYEALAAAVAAAYMNIPIVHMQGGESSGSIDESARHVITKLAQFHVPSTERASQFLVRMGEHKRTILTVGCPSSDLAATIDRTLSSEDLNDRGSGAHIDVEAPYLLSVFHPTTTEYGHERDEMSSVLNALRAAGEQTVLLWPNIDAGSDEIAKAIRMHRDAHGTKWLRVLTNLRPDTYLRVLANAACAVGNSSSFVRDAGFFGTPVVLVGNRQRGRERGEHVIPSGLDEQGISLAIARQLTHGRYPPSTLYGDGNVSSRVASALVDLNPYVQKRLAYVDEHG